MCDNNEDTYYKFAGKKQDELVALLETQEDFQNGKTLLEEKLAEWGARLSPLVPLRVQSNRVCLQVSPSFLCKPCKMSSHQRRGQVLQGPKHCGQLTWLCGESPLSRPGGDSRAVPEVLSLVPEVP